MELINNVTNNYLLIILAALTALTGILEALPKAWKPISGFSRRRRAQTELLTSISTNLSATSEGLKQLGEKVDRIATANEEQSIKLIDLQEKICQNEADRLQQEIFRYGNIARQRKPISSEEFRYLQTVWKKYSEDLHKNSIGHDEYLFVQEYYNSQKQENI